MAAPKSLSEQDLSDVRAELSAGKPSTVWFTSAAVGVPEGGSAKVTSLDDSAEGDFIQIKAAGSRDTMFCSPSELTRVRPARRRTPAPEQAVAAVAPEPAVTQFPQIPQVSDVPYESAPVAKPAKAPARPSVSRAKRPVDVTVTLSSTTEGEWTVEVQAGTRRIVRPTPVQPGEVAKAARSLPESVTEAIDASLQAARQRQLERVERLQAELGAAQRALQDLAG